MGERRYLAAYDDEVDGHAVVDTSRPDRPRVRVVDERTRAFDLVALIFERREHAEAFAAAMNLGDEAIKAASTHTG